MSRTSRNFSAKFKSELVIELLKGEKDLNTFATENNIQPNLLRNWKKEFLNKASVVFDDSREDNLKEKLSLECKEKAEYAKKVGQLTMQVDWLKKNLKKHLDLTTRINLVQNLLKSKELPVKIDANLMVSTVQAFIIRARQSHSVSLTAKRLLISYIRTIRLGAHAKCLLN